MPPERVEAGDGPIRFRDLPVDRADWDDWRWQMRNRVIDIAGLETCFRLTDEEREAVRRLHGALPVGITPYYISGMDPSDPSDPLRLTMIPRLAEFHAKPWEREDPLGERDHEVAPGLVHTYRNKVLFLVTDRCATYCRYCTRSRMVGGGEVPADRGRWNEALDYIRAHPEIDDVLLSGGDPLVLGDEKLGELLEAIRAIPHVSLIRLGTKIPAVAPQRVTPELVSILHRFHPLWFSIHFTHPAELRPEVAQACERLSNAGIPLMAQTVLLKGVNDDPEILASLMTGLLRLRVKPYYLHQCDNVKGSWHFKTPVEKGREIVGAMHGRMTGYGVPQYMIDAPGGGGKVPVSPHFITGRDGEDLLLRNREGILYRYPDPQEEE